MAVFSHCAEIVVFGEMCTDFLRVRIDTSALVKENSQCTMHVAHGTSLIDKYTDLGLVLCPSNVFCFSFHGFSKLAELDSTALRRWHFKSALGLDISTSAADTFQVSPETHSRSIAHFQKNDLFQSSV